MARRVAAEVLVELRRRLDRLAPRDAERGRLMAAAAELHGVSRATLYRQLREQRRPRPANRADWGQPRAMPVGALERYCEHRPNQHSCGFQPVAEWRPLIDR